MDLQTRKLNLIEYLVSITDEKIIKIFEDMIIKSIPDNDKALKPFTQKELFDRAKKSNQNYLNGEFKSQDYVEIDSQSW